MQEIMEVNNEVVTMTSLEVVELINNFRKEEGNEIIKKHDDMLKSIRKEIETLENAGIKGVGNFSESYYLNSQNKKQPCYKMNKAGIMQMLNKESALVRYKTQQYIEALENKLKQDPYENLSTEMKALLMHDKKIQEMQKQVIHVREDIKYVKSIAEKSTIDYEQQENIRELVNQRGTEILGGKKAPAYKAMSKKIFQSLWRDYKKYFKVNSYKNTAIKDYDSAINYVQNWHPNYETVLDINMINRQVMFV